MWLMLGDKTTNVVVPWLMMALVALLLGGILFAWLLGRLMGPKSNWGMPLTGQRKPNDDSQVDVWEESARRMNVERDERDSAS